MKPLPIAPTPVLAGAALAAALVASVVLAAWAQEPAHPSGNLLQGTVTDTLGSPLPFCFVRLEHSPSAVLCDSVGRFRLTGLSPDLVTFEVRRLGYVPGRFTVMPAADSGSRLVIQLVQVSTVLQPVTVTAGQPNPALVERGFYERLRLRNVGQGTGTFVTPEEFARLRVQHVTQALSDRPGVTMQLSGRLAVPWGRGGQCLLNVFVDGIEVKDLYLLPSNTRREGVSFQGAFNRTWSENDNRNSLTTGIGIDGFIQPSMVLAIEIYQSGPDTPIQFQSNNSCGSIVIWTKANAAAPPAKADSAGAR
jgi:hypothetical protein